MHSSLLVTLLPTHVHVPCAGSYASELHCGYVIFILYRSKEPLGKVMLSRQAIVKTPRGTGCHVLQYCWHRQIIICH